MALAARAAAKIKTSIIRTPGRPDRVRITIGGDSNPVADLGAEFGPGGVHVQYVHVDAAHRGEGLATELYRALGAVMRDRGVSTFLRDDMIQRESAAAVARLRAVAREVAKGKGPALGFTFNGENKAAQRAAERQGARLVTNVTTETRAAIRSIVSQSIRDGIAPIDAARMIRGSIGLNGPQAQAAANYYRELVDMGLSPEKVDKALSRYVERKVNERALLISRTEVLGALHRGAMESYGQAQAEGLLGKDATKTWIYTPDARVCDACSSLDGQTVPLKEPFQTPDGPMMTPPQHPACRCAWSPNP